jgi:hypothetical protein
MPDDMLRLAITEQEENLKGLDKQLQPMEVLKKRRLELFKLITLMRCVLELPPYVVASEGERGKGSTDEIAP